MSTKTAWQRKRDLAEAFRDLAQQCCAALSERNIGTHTGTFASCLTARCKRLQEASEALVEWEDCPGEHRAKNGGWQKEKAE